MWDMELQKPLQQTKAQLLSPFRHFGESIANCLYRHNPINRNTTSYIKGSSGPHGEQLEKWLQGSSRLTCRVLWGASQHSGGAKRA